MDQHQVEPVPGTPLTLPGYIMAHQINASEQKPLSSQSITSQSEQSKLSVSPSLPVCATYLLSTESYLTLQWFRLTVKQNKNLVHDIVFASLCHLSGGYIRALHVFVSKVIQSWENVLTFSCLCNLGMLLLQCLLLDKCSLEQKFGKHSSVASRTLWFLIPGP